MASVNSEVRPTAFINVQVIAIPEINPETGKTTYKATFIPNAITVSSKDTVINYQIIDPTPTDVIFKNMTISPKHTHQLSLPSISKSGKLVTFSNANTVKETINVTLHFKDRDNVEFAVDPEIINTPEP